MGYVYLICDPANDFYKVGITKGSIEKRMKQLQTGNGSELHIVSHYATPYPYKLEKLLHVKFGLERQSGEWFSLLPEEVFKFRETCKETEDTVKCLMDNPFFNKSLPR